MVTTRYTAWSQQVVSWNPEFYLGGGWITEQLQKEPEFYPCTRLDLQCRKTHDLGAMNLAPSPTRGLWGHSIENIATHSPGAMKLGPLEYKVFEVGGGGLGVRVPNG